MMIIELIVKINTGYYKKDLIVKNRTKIFKNYITSLDFYVNVLVIFPHLYDNMNIDNYLMILCYLSIKSIKIIT